MKANHNITKLVDGITIVVVNLSISMNESKSQPTSDNCTDARRCSKSQYFNE